MVSSITPTEFEICCMDILKEYAAEENLNNFIIEHNVKVPADDGIYQIDAYASFEAMGVSFKVLVECKQYSTPVKRDVVVLLADKVRSIGAHKGILMSTCGFQSGACEYAEKHGIALLQVLDKTVMHVKNAYYPDTEEVKRRLMLEQLWIAEMPKYYAYKYSETAFPEKRVYPSKRMLEDIRKTFAEKYKKLR